jgi:syntaxin 8
LSREPHCSLLERMVTNARFRLRLLSPPPPLPSKDEYRSGRELDPMTTPYKDDPDSARPYGDDPDTQPFDSAEMLESQRLMMQGVCALPLGVETFRLSAYFIAILSDQDTHLDSLHSSLTRQHSLSEQLSSELDVQAGLLTKLDTDIDHTASRLGRARRSLDRVGRGIGANGESKNTFGASNSS